jgi:hypothetical protein
VFLFSLERRHNVLRSAHSNDGMFVITSHGYELYFVPVEEAIKAGS